MPDTVAPPPQQQTPVQPAAIDAAKAAAAPAAKQEAPPLKIPEATGKAIFKLWSEGREAAERAAEEAAAKAVAEGKDKPDPTKDKTPDEPSTPAEPAKDQPPTPTPTPSADKTPKVKRRAPARTELETTSADVARLAAEETGKSVAKAITEATKAAAQTAKAPADQALSPEHKRKLEIFQQMAADQPDQYAALPDQYITGLRKVEEYRLKWLAENPGKKFDEDADEHADFFDAIEPRYDDDDRIAAVSALRQKPLADTAKKVEEQERELKRLRQAVAERSLEPVAQQARDIAAAETLAAIDPVMLDHFKDEASRKKAEQELGDEFAIAVSTAAVAGKTVAAAVRLLERADIDGKYIAPTAEEWAAPEAQEFMRVKDDIEQRIASLPEEQQMDESGRRFATWEEYNAMAKTSPQKASRYWFLDSSMLRRAIPGYYATVAKGRVEQMRSSFEARAKALGYVKPPGAAAQQPQPATKPHAPPAAPAPSPSAPAGKSQVSQTEPLKDNQQPEWMGNVMKVFRGERIA